MSGAKRSRTAQGVATERAVLDAMGVLDDPFARTMLGPTMALIATVVAHAPRRMRSGSPTLAGLAGRVLWFDDQVTAAMDAGIDGRLHTYRPDGTEIE